MIHYLQHNQIDKTGWDQCVAASLNRRIYAFSWYLDQVCQGWDALVEDDYISVFPLTHHKKWGIVYLYEPFFTQQLGIFSTKPITEDLVSGFLSQIPLKFKFAEIHLNSMNPLKTEGYKTFPRLNHEVGLSAAYELLYASYSQNTRRNLKKAREHGIQLSMDTTIDDLISLFRDNFGKKEGKLGPDHYRMLEGLLNELKSRLSGTVCSVVNNSGKLMAAAFILTDSRRHYFLFAASDPAARENGAMFFLIDQIINKYAGSETILDFEGGNDPNLARFYKGFGACEVVYPALRINRLPFLLWTGIRIIRKIRN